MLAPHFATRHSPMLRHPLPSLLATPLPSSLPPRTRFPRPRPGPHMRRTFRWALPSSAGSRVAARSRERSRRETTTSRNGWRWIPRVGWSWVLEEACCSWWWKRFLTPCLHPARMHRTSLRPQPRFRSDRLARGYSSGGRPIYSTASPTPPPRKSAACFFLPPQGFVRRRSLTKCDRKPSSRVLCRSISCAFLDLKIRGFCHARTADP